MSIREQLDELGVDTDELVDDLVRSTIPGGSNQPYYDGLDRATDLVPFVLDDLNNWFEIVDVRIYDDDHIAMPMRYRWSIVRWAENDMDQWLMDNGWEDLAHLNADSRTRQENEIEARYRKEFDGVTVDCNFIVLFPDVVFRKMNGEDLDRVKRKKEKEKRKQNTIEEVIEARRDHNV